VFRSFGVVSGARVAATTAQALTLLIMARSLGVSAFGQFAAVLGGMTALGILADGGATYAVGRHHTTPPTILQILRASRLLSLATLLVSVPVLAVLVHLSGSAILAACLLLCAWIPLERQAEISSAYLLVRGRRTVVCGTYLLRRLPTLAALLLIPAGVMPVLTYAVTMVTAAAVSMVVLGRRVTEELAVVPAARAGARLHSTLLPERATWTLLRPFWFATAGQGVRQIDVAVLSVAAGSAVAGVFAPASRLVPALLLVPGTYTQLLLGRLSAGQASLTARRLVGLAVVATTSFSTLAVLAELWVPLLLGEDYLASVDVIRVVTASLVFAALSSMIASSLHATDRAAYVAAAVWTGATTTIGLIAVLGATYGAMGAAGAVAAGYVLQFVLMALLHRVRRATPDGASGSAVARERDRKTCSST
jgi:O-antigen/teichoic acid export membrane protein